MAKMRTRRSSLIKARDPLLECVERLRKARNVGRELLKLAAAHERAPLVDGVIGGRLAESLGRVTLPIHKRTPAKADAMRGNIADQAGELFFHVGPPVAHEIAKLRRQFTVAAHAREGDAGGGLGSIRLQPAIRGDAHAHRRRERQAQLQRLPGEACEPLAGPVLAREQWVQHKAKGHRRGGLSRGRGLAQCICWMPARSQPLEPSLGFTRFHTSSKPTGSVPGVSRTMPEKRTLAQYLSFSDWTSRRSAFSATTSVCCASAGVSRRSSSKSAGVVNSRMSSMRPASFAICSLMKFILAARRKPAVSKPAGTREALATPVPVGCEGGGAATVSSPKPANWTGRVPSSRRRTRA